MADKNGGLTPEKVGQELVAEERWRQVLNSLVICMFARNLYTPDLVQRALQVAGMERSTDDLARLGQETLTLKHEFKRHCGFDLEGVRIPRRVLETADADGRAGRRVPAPGAAGVPARGVTYRVTRPR